MSSPPPRLNVLLIVADDLRPQLGAYGRPETSTPHLDRLARGALTFERAYAQVPTCNPSRNSFLTGRSPDHPLNRIYWFEGNAPALSHNIFALLKVRGYVTLGVGKLFHWAMGAAFFSQTFSPENGQYYPEMYDQEWGCGPPCRATVCSRSENCGSNGRVYVDGGMPEGAFFDANVAREARERLRRANATGRPFALGVGFHHPHFKWHVPTRLWAGRYASEAEIRPVARPLPSAGLPLHAMPDQHLTNVDLSSGERINTRRETKSWWRVPMPARAQLEMRRGYSAAVTWMDEQAGSVLDELKRLHLQRSTLVIATSDHGFALGEGGSWGKNGLLELQTRVPLILRHPGALRSHGARSAAPVELLDLVPTILDLAAHERPVGWEGTSLRRRLDPVEATLDLAAHERPVGWEGTSLRRRLDPVEATSRIAVLGDVAVSQLARCYAKGARWPGGTDGAGTTDDVLRQTVNFACKGKYDKWSEGVHPSVGPGCALMGYSLRSATHRYIAWMRVDGRSGEVLWSWAPYVEELYDHRPAHASGGSPGADFDEMDVVNLLYPPQSAASADRATAERHLRALYHELNRRREMARKKSSCHMHMHMNMSMLSQCRLPPPPLEALPAPRRGRVRVTPNTTTMLFVGFSFLEADNQSAQGFDLRRGSRAMMPDHARSVAGAQARIASAGSARGTTPVRKMG